MSLVIPTLYLAIVLYSWLIVARAVMSWIPLRRGTVGYRIYEMVFAATEPYLKLFRRLIPMSRVGGVGLDWSSVVALLALFVVLQVLQRL